MNFVLYFSFEPFSASLKAGSTAHVVPFALASGKPDETTGYVLITTDAGVEGGTIHALQVELLDRPFEGLRGIDFAVQASELVEDLLKHRSIKVLRGVLLTAGMQESLKYWGHVNRLSLAQLSKSLAEAKEKALNGRRRNQNNK